MKTSIQPDKLLKIYQQFPELNFEWLLIGVGNMTKDDNINKPYNDDFMNVLLEMFQKGEIFPAVVVRQKNEEIANLHKQIAILEAKLKEHEEGKKNIKMEARVPEAKKNTG